MNLLGINLTTNAQTIDLGNDWYVPSQSYIKLLVAKDGIYRVSLTQLQNAGVSTSTLDPDRIQVFFRGEEVPVYVEKNGTQLVFFEFFGKRNDGRVDSLMYRSAGNQLHDPNAVTNANRSLFTDTAVYFLTWDNTPTTNRYSTYINTNYTSYSPEAYYRTQYYQEFYSAYLQAGGGNNNPSYILNSDYVPTQGYLDAFPLPRTYTIPTPRYFASGNPNKITARIAGTTSFTHIIDMQINNTSVYLDTSNGVLTKTHQAFHSGSLNNTTQIKFRAIGSEPSRPDGARTCWFTFDYDRSFDLGGAIETKIIEWEKSGISRLEFANATVNTEAVLYDLSTKTRVQASINNNTLDFLLPGAVGKRTLWLATDAAIKTPLIIPQTSLSNLAAPNAGAEYVIITHRNFTNSASAYKQYRDTCTVNPIPSTKIIYVDQIYDEFGYGSVTPWAIKRFCKAALDNWATQPQFFLLWGKGQYETRNKPNCFVPTFGYPATDWEYVANFDKSQVNHIPKAAIGRVNIYTDAEGIAYLNKVNIYEHAPYAEWMKKAVLLGGGEHNGESNAIFSGLNSYMQRMRSSEAAIESFYWQKYETYTNSNTSSPSSEPYINAGAALIHFFGHSSTNVFDIDILEAGQYKNDKKFPIMIAFGCYGGNFSTDAKSFGERFIIEAQSGSIAYLANSTAGYLSYLRNYGQVFYRNAFQDHFGEPLGKLMQQSVSDYFNTYGTSIITLNHARQLNLQGDPLLRFTYPQKPDLAIEEEDVIFPTNLSAETENFVLKLLTHNLGARFVDSFRVAITVQNAVGQTHSYSIRKFPPIAYQDTLTFTLENPFDTEFAGLNFFDIYVDENDTIEEYYENNNRIAISKLIESNQPAPLFPLEYAIIPNNTVKLAASTYAVTQDQFNYVFEIDTSHEFSSPIKRISGLIAGTSTFAEWEVPLTLTAGQVYYWRVRIANIYPESWAYSSFKYVPDITGWSQSHPPQFFKDPTSQLSIDQDQWEWSFGEKEAPLNAFVEPGDPGNYLLSGGLYKTDPIAADRFSVHGIVYTPISKRTLAPGYQDGTWDDCAYLGDDKSNLIHDINAAPDGEYFVIISQRNPNVPSWNQQLIRAMYQIGCDTARFANIPNSGSFVFVGRKGIPGSGILVTEPNEFLSTGPRLSIRTGLTAPYDAGNIYSTRIGPSSDWGSARFDWKALETLVGDSVAFQIFGVRQNNTDSLIFSYQPEGQYNIQSINAEQFPYLRLEAVVKDEAQVTAPQLNLWEVEFEGVPEAIIDPVTHYSFFSDTVEEGQEVLLHLSTRNISNKSMDSLLVRYTVQRADRSRILLAEQRIAPLLARDELEFEYSFSTAGKGLSENCQLIVEINPEYDQPEQYSFNNTFVQPFFVQSDRLPPLLDVTFDGKHLQEGDIVSPLPEIIVQSNDENRYLPLSVTDSTYKMWFGPGYFEYETRNLLPSISIASNPLIEAVDGRLPDNKAQLVFRPGRLADGEYTLIVEAKDAKGNQNNGPAYVIHFEVVNQKAISNVLNYPNPFSSRTQFVYTLTGDELPETFEIHIYTVSGKRVKVIDLAALGEVHFGYNITEYAWDGRDDFGDQLANGVYLYKVVTRFRDGAQPEQRDEGISEYFKNGWGKLYLMR